MGDASSQPPKPPQPPEMERRFMLYPFQMIGIPLLILLPLLAVFGVLGETRATASTETPAVLLSVEYPTRAHYEAMHIIRIMITNSGEAALPQLTVRIDSDYLNAFSSLAASPAFDRITAEAFVVDLEDISPGESRAVVIDATASEYGWHSGPVTVSAESEDLARVNLETLIFP